MSTRRLSAPFALAAALMLSVPAGAQDTSKGLRLMVPFPPGGAVDIIARTLGPHLSRGLGQNVIIDNRPGGNTMIAAELVLRAPADGGTVFFMAPSYTITPAVRSKMNFDAAKDFTGVTKLASTAMLLSVHPSLPVKNLKDLLGIARARPGELTFATASVIGAQRLMMEQFKLLAKVDMTSVPYNGGAPATMAVLGGHTTILVANVAETAPHVLAGKLRGVVVTTVARSDVLPNVPTIAESGFPGFDNGNWFGALVRSGTPRPAIDRLNQEIVRALELPEVRETLVKIGLLPAPSTPDAFTAFVLKQMEVNGHVARTLNLKID